MGGGGLVVLGKCPVLPLTTCVAIQECLFYDYDAAPGGFWCCFACPVGGRISSEAAACASSSHDAWNRSWRVLMTGGEERNQCCDDWTARRKKAGVIWVRFPFWFSFLRPRRMDRLFFYSICFVFFSICCFYFRKTRKARVTKNVITLSFRAGLREALLSLFSAVIHPLSVPGNVRLTFGRVLSRF